jgi:hypothetical protein
VWTCAVCASDGPGVMMSCANKCRACVDCGFLRNPPHTCTDRKDLFKELQKLGAQRESLCLPDCGKGKLQWESLCRGSLKWADPKRTFFGVKDCKAIIDMIDSNDDPLHHPDAVALP